MMKNKMIGVLLAILTIGLIACADENVVGDNDEELDYSNQSLKIIVPWESGGLTDATARLLSEEVVEYLPEESKVVVENRPGASGGLGSTEVANAKPDGHTISISPLVPVTEGPHFGQVSYEYTDFEPIAQLLSTPTVFAVSADSDIETYDDFIEYAKENPNDFSYGSPGAGTLDHIVMEEVASENGISIDHVPYEGTAPMISDILGGHVDGGHMQIPDLVPHIKDGTIRILWNSGSEGYPHMPEDTPTISELGIDMEMDAKTSIVGPVDLPEEMRDELAKAFEQAMQSDEFQEKMENANFVPEFEGPEKLQETIEERYKLSGEIIEDAGIEVTD